MVEIQKIIHNISNNVWLLQFLLGMFIAYYIMSPRLRRFSNRLIVWVFHPGSPFTKPKHRVIKKPAKSSLLDKAQPYQIGASNKHINADESTIEEWLNANPDLRKANEA